MVREENPDDPANLDHCVVKGRLKTSTAKAIKKSHKSVRINETISTEIQYQSLLALCQYSES